MLSCSKYTKYLGQKRDVRGDRAAIRRLQMTRSFPPRKEKEEMPQKKQFDESMAKILYDKGCDDTEISAATNVSRDYVATWRRRNGLAPNKKTEPKPEQPAPAEQPSTPAADQARAPAAVATPAVELPSEQVQASALEEMEKKFAARIIQSASLEARLKHLLGSEFICQFDAKDPKTGQYVREIAEADAIAMRPAKPERDLTSGGLDRIRVLLALRRPDDGPAAQRLFGKLAKAMLADELREELLPEDVGQRAPLL